MVSQTINGKATPQPRRSSLAVYKKKRPNWRDYKGDKQYAPYWYIQFRLSGKTYCYSSGTANKAKAMQMERQHRSDLHAKAKMGAKDSITLLDAIELYRKSKENTPSYKTYKSMAKVLTARWETAGLMLDQLTTAQITKYDEEQRAAGKAGQTRKHFINFVRGMIKLCRSLGYSVPVSIEYPKIPTTPGRLRVLSDDEELALLDELRTDKYLEKWKSEKYVPTTMIEQWLEHRQDVYDFVILLLDTGARCSEIARLTWDQINLADETITLHRTKSARAGFQNISEIYMSSRVKAAFQRRSERLRHDTWVFPNRAGTSYRRSPGLRVRAAMKKAKIKGCTLHDFRHSFATKLIRNGCSLSEVSLMLGHSDPSVTLRYAHFAEADVGKKARNIIERLNQPKGTALHT